MDNKKFYEYTKKYALNQLSEYYVKEEKLPNAEAIKKAEVKINSLIKPAANYDINNKNVTLKDIFVRLIISCQNRTMMPNVIKFSDRKEQFARILQGFDYAKILTKYKTSENLYNVFEKKFNVNRDHNKLWVLFSKSVMDAAKFISKFKDVEDFKRTINNIAIHFPYSMMIPKMISEEIDGMGEILACDFIKEIGYVDFAKPDVHIDAIIKTLKGRDMKPKEVLMEVQNIATAANTTTFEIDKLLWLVSSGKYYDVKGKEKTIQIKNKEPGISLRDEFLKSLTDCIV